MCTQLNCVLALQYRREAGFKMLSRFVHCHFCPSIADLISVSSCRRECVLLQPMRGLGSADISDCCPQPLSFVFCCVVITTFAFSAVSLLLWKSLLVWWLVMLGQKALLKCTICWFSTLKHLFLIWVYSEMYVNHLHRIYGSHCCLS